MRLFLLVFIALAIRLNAQPVEANLLGQWSDPTLPGSSAYDNTYNEIWGLAVNGHEYAIIGSTFGTHFIDVTDPENPIEKFRIPGAAQGGQVIHRDYHDYQGYLYAVCDEGPSTLQIMDISQLPDTVAVVYNSSELFNSAHNIFIDTAATRLYCFSVKGGPHFYSKMQIYDLSDPLNPVFLDAPLQFGPLNPSHIHDGYVRDNVAFLNCERKGLAVIDYSDVFNPVTIGSLPSNAYLQSGYNHSGWATDDCRHYVMADETWGMDLKMVSMAEKPELEAVTYFDTDSGIPTSIPHNQIIACDYLYVSYYYEGLQVYDISNPSQPQRVLYYDTSDEPDGQSYKGAWGVYPFLPSGNILVSDMQNGLFVFEGIDDDCNPLANLQPCTLTTNVSDHANIQPSFSIFPNPAALPGEDVHLRVYSPTVFDEMFIQVSDIHGKVVAEFDNYSLHTGKNEFTLPLQRINRKGVFILKCKFGNNEWAGKIVFI